MLAQSLIGKNMTQDNRILISGAGPVGSITGYYLAKHGVPVSVFDTAPLTPRDHRASTVHPTTLQMLASIGITEKIIPQGIISPIFQFRDRFDDRVVAEFDYGILSDIFDFPFALQVEQHKVINTTHEIAKEYDTFELRRPCEVIGHVQDEDGVTLKVKNQEGEIEDHRGLFLLGTDGGRSVTRKDAGIDFPGFTWPDRFVIATTEYDFGTQKGGKHHYRNYVAHPVQWCALIKVAGDDMAGLWRILLPAMDDDPSGLEIGSSEWVQKKFVECLPYEDEYKIIDINPYNVHQRVAETFHKGRVLLAGDAAHVNNPLGGMGMNGGIHDGVNLAEKLLHIWREDKSANELLAQYDRQRRPTALKYVQAQSIANKELLQETDMQQRRQRLDVLAATAEDRDRCRGYLKKSSLWTMLEEAKNIT